MNAKQMAAICSTLGLLSSAAYADSGNCNKSNCSPCTPCPAKECPRTGPCVFEQGTPIECDQVMSDMNKDGKFMVPQGINHAGGIHTSGMDFYVTGSFIYWMASTDGLNEGDFPYNYAWYPGTAAAAPAGYGPAVACQSGATTCTPIGNVASDPAAPTASSGVVDGSEVFVRPKFKPGFKVGIGYTSDFDDWDLYLEYTYLHTKEHNSFNANELRTTTGSCGSSSTSASSTNNAFLLAGAPYNWVGDGLEMEWKNHLDVLDFSLGRAYYVGKRVILEPFAGVRAAWIRQSWDVNLNAVTTGPWVTNPTTTDIINANMKCHSWGVGARLGMHSQWLLGWGFRLDAKASGSMLFTRYTKISESSCSPTAGKGLVPPPRSFNYRHHYDTMRANAEMGLGFGWGTYFGCDDGWHIDLVATYDFNIWFDQNMLRSTWDTIRLQSGNYPTDIMYHGPTVTVRLDF